MYFFGFCTSCALHFVCVALDDIPSLHFESVFLRHIYHFCIYTSQFSSFFQDFSLSHTLLVLMSTKSFSLCNETPCVSPLVCLFPRPFTAVPLQHPCASIFPSAAPQPAPRLQWLARWPRARSRAAVKAANRLRSRACCDEPPTSWYDLLTRALPSPLLPPALRLYLRTLCGCRWARSCLPDPSSRS
jgi:hypothetical protein